MTLPGPDWPSAWQTRRRYLPWRATPRHNGTIGKVPLNQVDPLDSRAWQSWDAAWAAVQAGQASGVGLAITPALQLTAIDLDACLDEMGEITPPAQAVLDTFPGAYIERSPSGRGLHMLVRGVCPPGWRRQAGMELIDRGFLTVTGLGHNFPHTRLPYDAGALAAWHAWSAPQTSAGMWAPRVPPMFSPGSWFARACAARNGAKFRALWDGHLADCPTASEGDLQLLLLIIYWCPSASDSDLLSALLSSGRKRPKVLSERYLERTLIAVRRLQRAAPDTVSTWPGQERIWP